jgi:AraC-like DNA-binding protein/effector-binding domain-containing protein
MPSRADLLTLLSHVRGRLDGDVSLDALAGRAGWSSFHLHRAFRRLMGETPKAYTQRLRLDRAAGRLAASTDRIVDVAFDSGFASHEVFTRAFTRRFGRSPERYRAIARAQSTAEARARHAVITETAGPCLTLYHVSLDESRRSDFMPTPTIERKELQPQPALIVKRRVARSEIATTIAESLGKTFPYALQNGLAIAGRPFVRYSDVGPGLMTMETGTPLAEPAPGVGEIEAITLPGGPAAVAVHMGPYDKLQDTYAALERWMQQQGVRAAGAPWESYITDPAEHPDPANWRTDVYWPISE